MKNQIKTKDLLKFLVFSILGVVLLMLPLKAANGGTTILVSTISKFIKSAVESLLPIHYIILIAIIISVVGPILYSREIIKKNKITNAIFSVNTIWFAVRVIGLIFAVFTIFGFGPEAIRGENTGSLVLFDLIGSLFTIFLVAGFALPLLTDFGLLEFIGVYLSKIMRPVFNLPGRSAVDCVASWVGDGTIGVALTNKQYEEGYYTEKEASIIATTFSAVSITFCLVVLENVGLMNHFTKFYFVVGLAGIVAALVVPRIYPLANKKDTRLVDNKLAEQEFLPKGENRFRYALKLAVEKANRSSNLRVYLENAAETVLGLWIAVVPVIMAVGTGALIISEYSPVFTYLGMPFIPILNLLQVPEAKLASETLVVGFADMVVPSILAGNIQSEMTRFVVAAVSVTQLIYLSETGAVILGSKIPVSLWELFVLFLQRTLITLPVIVLFAHLFFNI